MQLLFAVRHRVVKQLADRWKRFNDSQIVLATVELFFCKFACSNLTPRMPISYPTLLSVLAVMRVVQCLNKRHKRKGLIYGAMEGSASQEFSGEIILCQRVFEVSACACACVLVFVSWPCWRPLLFINATELLTSGHPGPCGLLQTVYCCNSHGACSTLSLSEGSLIRLNYWDTWWGQFIVCVSDESALIGASLRKHATRSSTEQDPVWGQSAWNISRLKLFSSIS